MGNLSIKFAGTFVVLMFTFQMVTFPQDWSDSSNSSSKDSSDPFGGDPFGGMLDSTQINQPIQQQDNSTQTQPSSSNSSKSDHEQTRSKTNQTPFPNSQNKETESSSIYNSQPQIDQTQANSESPVQDAIIEGVQLTSEKNEKQTDEKTISCYFIFRDKPSSYYYEVKIREKKITFEFNDTRVGTSPVPTVSELPIKGFSIEQKKVDVNKDVRGLIPEWHDLIKVTFDMDAVPIIHVNDEYSLISFSFKWTTDPAKMPKYTLKDNTPKVILWSTAGIGSVGLGALTYFLLHKEPIPPPLGPLSIDDLPVHSEKK